MLTKALKTFAGRYGLIQAGTVFECEPGYFHALKQNNLVEAAKDSDLEKKKPSTPGPSDNRALPGAPLVKTEAEKLAREKAEAEGKGENAEATGATSDQPQENGKVLTSSSLRADLRSRAKTSKRSEGGETPKT